MQMVKNRNGEDDSAPKRRRRMRMILSLCVFGLLLVSDLFCLSVILLLDHFGILVSLSKLPYLWVLLSVISSTVLGWALFSVVMTVFFAPLEKLTSATERIAQGDMDTSADLMPHNLMDNTEVGTLARSFSNMTRRLAANELFHKDFVSNFSHEFKTPIISIRGFARQLYSRHLSSEQIHEYAGIIADESEALANMSTNVMLLSRLEHQEVVTGQKRFSLDEQLRRCMLLFEEQWSAKKLHVEMDLDEVSYYQNEELIGYIWKNLMSNAVKFSREGGRMQINCKKQPDGGVRVSVQDTGIGMSEALMQHIFEPFYQGEPSHSGQGNGLGLPLVKRVLCLVGGSVEVSSREGEGSCFTVFLPETKG